MDPSLKEGSARAREVVAPGASHGMVQAEAGCMDEFEAGSSSPIAPLFLDTLKEWLRKVRQ